MLTLADLQALESYLARRLDVPVETRTLLATKLAENIAEDELRDTGWDEPGDVS